MKQRRPLLLLLALVALVGAAWSSLLIALPSQPTLDERVYEVGAQLKCPVCQGESVADSSAAVSEQMRLVIRQQLREGRSEQQVLRYFAVHYGNQILLTPPQQGFHLLAWLMPVGMLLPGLALMVYVLRDWRARGRTQAGEDDGLFAGESDHDPELEPYRAQLARELAEEDPLMEIE